MTQFRNRLVYLYWEVDAEIGYDIPQKNLPDFDIFAGCIIEYMSRQTKT